MAEETQKNTRKSERVAYNNINNDNGNKLIIIIILKNSLYICQFLLLINIVDVTEAGPSANMNDCTPTSGRGEI